VAYINKNNIIKNRKILRRTPKMSILENKKVIIIGDRDGIPGEAIKECVETVESATVVFASTECFV